MQEGKKSATKRLEWQMLKCHHQCGLRLEIYANPSFFKSIDSIVLKKKKIKTQTQFYTRFDVIRKSQGRIECVPVAMSMYFQSEASEASGSEEIEMFPTT